MGKVDRDHSMNVRRAVEIQLHSFLNSALDGGERLTSLPLALRPGNKTGTHRIGYWVGRKFTLDVFEIEKDFHFREFETRTVQCRQKVSENRRNMNFFCFPAGILF
jgi:hypothetical protein